jgi:hypothetical protein
MLLEGLLQFPNIVNGVVRNESYCDRTDSAWIWNGLWKLVDLVNLSEDLVHTRSDPEPSLISPVEVARGAPVQYRNIRKALCGQSLNVT